MRVSAAAEAAALAALIGCASPGPPLPPTLNLPEPPAAGGLSAERIGNSVHVTWATPQRTTDHLPIKGAVTAEICRAVSDALLAAPQQGAPGGRNPRETEAEGRNRMLPCAPVVAREAVKPGTASQAEDVLPPELDAGPPRLLIYRVQLKNASGRTAGPSTAAFAAAGGAPAALEGFHAHAAKAGIVLEWSAEPGPGGDAVQLERTTLAAPTDTKTAPPGRSAGVGLLGPSKEPAELKLAGGLGADGADAGGTIDRSAQVGHTYRYIAWRVRTVTVAGQRLEMRGPSSSAATVPFEDVFPPDAPQGLVAVPATVGEGEAAKPAIDLSWEPNAEPRLAGYRVYRRVAGTGEWERTSGADLLLVAAYRDPAVVSGIRYEYRVTAVGLNGLESPAGKEAEEAVGAP